MNETETIVANILEELGIEWIKSGFPDFMCYSEKDKHFFFIEVKLKREEKTKTGGLNSNQIKSHKLLENAGITVRTIYV